MCNVRASYASRVACATTCERQVHILMRRERNQMAAASGIPIAPQSGSFARLPFWQRDTYLTSPTGSASRFPLAMYAKDRDSPSFRFDAPAKKRDCPYLSLDEVSQRHRVSVQGATAEVRLPMFWLTGHSSFWHSGCSYVRNRARPPIWRSTNHLISTTGNAARFPARHVRTWSSRTLDVVNSQLPRSASTQVMFPVRGVRS
jgi:hypothetical protein